MATKKMATEKTAGKKRGSSGKQVTGAKEGTGRKASAPRSMPKEGKDPQGGLTAKGRAYFNEKEGSHLRPGVQGPADTPEKMVRKGSFLRRHFAHPRGPMKDDKGQPTRLALSAHAWGEPVPKTAADAKKLANKGHELLEHYHQIQEGSTTSVKSSAKSSSSSKRASKTAASPRAAAGKKAVSKPAVNKAKAKATGVSGASNKAAKKTPRTSR